MDINEALLNCISAFLRGEKLMLELNSEEWTRLLKKAQEQKTLPMLFEAAGESMPPELFAAVKKNVRSLVVAQTQRTFEFKNAYKALSDKGIAPLVVKGIVCRSVWSKPDFRASADEDLYYPLPEYEKLHEALCGLGFDAKSPDYENAHEERYTKNGLLIEGHWELFPQENSALDALNELSEGFWSRAKIREIDGEKILTLSDTDHEIFLLLHAFKHFIASGVGIRQLCDISLWAQKCDIDWDRVKTAVENANAERFAAAVFDAGEKYFGMEHPENFDRKDCTSLIRDALDGGIYGTANMSRKRSASMTLEAVEAAEGGRRSNPVLKALFPNRAVLEMRYPWVKKSAALIPAAWAARIFAYLSENNSSSAESLRIGTERMELLKEYEII